MKGHNPFNKGSVWMNIRESFAVASRSYGDFRLEVPKSVVPLGQRGHHGHSHAGGRCGSAEAGLQDARGVSMAKMAWENRQRMRTMQEN